jgi:hypothetical protein
VNADAATGGTKANMAFSSKYGASKGWSTMWNPLQFHVHHPSEHTINGKLFELEVHMVHLNPADATAKQVETFGTALTLTAADAFFAKWVAVNKEQNLDMGTTVHDLYSKVDWNNRWAYEGSLTTPPCTRLAFFNVAKKVIPVSEATVKAVKDKMTQEDSRFFTKWSGNNRPPQPLNGQNVVEIVNAVDPEANKDAEAAARSQTLFIVFLVLFFLALIGFIVVCTMLCKAQSENKTSETELGQASVEGEIKGNTA